MCHPGQGPCQPLEVGGQLNRGATKISGSTEKISHFPLIIQIRSSEYFNLGWHIFSLSVSYDAAGRLHQKKVDGGWDGRGFQSVSELTFGIS